MKTMITGVRPTGSITLANYIGGIKGFVEQQDKYSSLKEEVKISYDEAVMEEKAIKEAFAKRKEAVHASKNINNNISRIN